MSDPDRLAKTLTAILYEGKHGLATQFSDQMIEAIIADGRIGVLPTRSELEDIWSGSGFAGTRTSAMIAAGYAREDDEPMLKENLHTQPEYQPTPDLTPEVESYILGRRAFEESRTTDPDSAAVDAIADLIASELSDREWRTHTIARSVLDFLREHPEHLGWFTMTADTAMIAHWTEMQDQLPWIVVANPDPDPPAAEVPTLRDELRTMVFDSHGAARLHPLSEREIDMIMRAVEAANGGGAK